MKASTNPAGKQIERAGLILLIVGEVALEEALHGLTSIA